MPSQLGHLMRRYTLKGLIIHNDSQQAFPENSLRNFCIVLVRNQDNMIEEHKVLLLVSKRKMMFSLKHKNWRMRISTSTKKLTEISDPTILWLVLLLIMNTMFLITTTMSSKITRVTVFMSFWKRLRIWVLLSHRPLTRLLSAPRVKLEEEMDLLMLTAELAVKSRKNRAIQACQRDQVHRSQMQELTVSKIHSALSQEEDRTSRQTRSITSLLSAQMNKKKMTNLRSCLISTLWNPINTWEILRHFWLQDIMSRQKN